MLDAELDAAVMYSVVRGAYCNEKTDIYLLISESVPRSGSIGRLRWNYHA